MAKSGTDVTLIDAWPEHINAIREHGLHVTGTQGTFHVPVKALHLHEVRRLQASPIDVAMLCVKSYDTSWMTHLLRDYLSPGGIVVSVQNGMNEESIASVVGWGRVLGCIVNTIGVELVKPGEVLRWMAPAGPGYIVFRVGEVHGRATKRAQRVADALSAVDNAGVTTNLWGERWSKLVNNAMASAIGPLTGMSVREMFGNHATRRLSIRLGFEAIRVGDALGFPLEKICAMAPELWLEAGDGSSEALARIEQGLISWQERIGPEGQASTLHDIRRGRRTEIDSINGLVAQKGAEAGVAVPLHAELTALVKKLERGEFPQGMESIAHLFQ